MQGAALSCVRQRVQVPNLAYEIVTRQRGMPDRNINLQGFLVGEHKAASHLPQASAGLLVCKD